MGERFVDITIVSGHFLHNFSALSNMDTFVSFVYNDRAFKTTVAKGTGLNSTWNEAFRLKPLTDVKEVNF
jgi:Ca2+-dependent lipid-binding protein